MTQSSKLGSFLVPHLARLARRVRGHPTAYRCALWLLHRFPGLWTSVVRHLAPPVAPAALASGPGTHAEEQLQLSATSSELARVRVLLRQAISR